MIDLEVLQVDVREAVLLRDALRARGLARRIGGLVERAVVGSHLSA